MFKAYLENLTEYLEWSSDIRPSESLYRCIELSYEWEYKYRQITADPKLLTKRKENTLNLIEKKMAPVFDFIIGALHETLYDWISEHNITDPSEWAYTRFIKPLSEDSGWKQVVYRLYDEWVEFDKTKTQIKVLLDFCKAELKDFKPFIADLLDKEIIKEHNNGEYIVANSLKSIKSNITWETLDLLEQINTGLSKDTIVRKIYVSDQAYKKYKSKFEHAITDYAEHYLFPKWYKYWYKAGFKNTYNRVVDLYNEANDYTDFENFNKTIVLMHKLLNTTHQNGKMMDYVADHYDVSKDDLDNFSNVHNFAKWNKELHAMNIYTTTSDYTHEEQ